MNTSTTNKEMDIKMAKGMTSSSFETTIGDDDLEVVVEYGYTYDSDETGSFIDTELYKVYLQTDKSKTDIQCLCYNVDFNLRERADKDAQDQRESDEEDAVESRLCARY